MCVNCYGLMGRTFLLWLDIIVIDSMHFFEKCFLKTRCSLSPFDLCFKCFPSPGCQTLKPCEGWF